MPHSVQFALLGTTALAVSFSYARAHSPPQNDERFGVMTHFAQGWDPTLIPTIAHAMIPQVRDELYWASVEPTKGRFSFPAAYDRYMAALNQHLISPLVVLSFENPNYDGGDTPHSDEAIAAYARYAVEVLRHYGHQIKAVEIWNEYNGTFNHGPATQDRAGTYLRMLRAAYVAIKHERPDVIVVGGATSGTPLPYWKKLLVGGGLEFMDALSVHSYCYESPPEGLEGGINALRALVQKYDGGNTKPIWVTETGWFTKASEAPGDLAIDDVVQAKFLTRAYALLLSAGAERIYWYLLRDDRGLNMGLFHGDPSNAPKPASLAFTTLVQQLRGTRFVRRDPTPDDFYSLVFARASGEEVRVVWSLTPTNLSTRGAVSAVDFQGHPVALTERLNVDDAALFIQGNLSELPPASAAKTLLADSANDFSGTQGTNGWFYGTQGGRTKFAVLPDYATTDWTSSWTGAFPAISLTANDQHPSVVDNAPVAAVRRWQSSVDGRVRVKGRFHCGTNGDGVGVSILVDEQPRFRKLLGGGKGKPIAETFDFVQAVHPGSVIDFAVDPGPAANIDYDATTVAITITKEAP